MSDSARLASDLTALVQLGTRQSLLSDPAARAGIAAKAGVSSQSNSGGGGGGNATENSTVARTYFNPVYATTPDGLFVFELAHLNTLPMKDAAQSPITWTFANR